MPNSTDVQSKSSENFWRVSREEWHNCLALDLSVCNWSEKSSLRS